MRMNWMKLGSMLLLIALTASLSACGESTLNHTTQQPTDKSDLPTEIERPTEIEEEPEVIKETIDERVKKAIGTLEVWDGSVAESFDGGDGSNLNPYQISNGAQLAKLARDVNSNGIDFENKYFILTSDIVLNRFVNWDFDKIYRNYRPFRDDANCWIPIGVYNYFMGNFDGCNYTIYGMHCVGDYNVVSTGAFSGIGLFGHIRNASVSNVNLVCSGLLGKANYYGGIAAMSEWSRIENCHSEEIIISPTYTDNCNAAGGIMGAGSSDKCYNCSASGLILTNVFDYNEGNSMYKGYFGGIAGKSNEIYDCYSNVDVIVNHHLISPKDGEEEIRTLIGVGGIVGQAGQDDGDAVENCFNEGNVAFIGPRSEWEAPHNSRAMNIIAVGGIAGICDAERIENCANIGMVNESLEYYGWVFDELEAETWDWLDEETFWNLQTDKPTHPEDWPLIVVGGIIGYTDRSAVSRCYSSQVVSSDLDLYSWNTGGIVGGANLLSSKNKVSVTNCYYNSVYLSSAVGRQGSGVFTDQVKGLVEDEMKDSNNYYGFDFNTTWTSEKGINNGFPILVELIKFIQ